MSSIDTNVLLYAQNQDCPENDAATAFLVDCAGRTDVAVCELVLTELYQLLRNPAVLTRPLDGPEAAEVCQTFRRNPRWAIIENAPVMNEVWVLAATPGIPRRRPFETRLALALRHHGVDEFATRNINDFTDFGFSRVWDPITSNH
ncbi:type II toxin-antitoxin system VapC family toxin [Mycobacterium lacus]|uniref:type II toxin-antitoxin system VapC family toxin n=1 Tax=Mycobacterium lacus TaxID=169765 RepID=UPI000A16987A|nr:type II toxin-antitoxin system VapC family toxin [Mycobacterium lacus]MCV7125007.1 type II toxin-antitoxin system VapC family toxin [Mycobacterium lacus]ORW10055.1 ribonuclease [Mycobacterium lacus]